MIIECMTMTQFCGYVQIFIDASKNSGSQVGVSFNIPEFQIKIEKKKE